MAVKIRVVGEADLREIERAQATLKKMEYEAVKSGNSMAGSFARFGASATRLGGSMQDLGSSMTRGVTLPLAALGAGLYKATQAAADDAQAQVVLATTLRNTAGATQAQVASVEAWITAQGKAKGVADDELRPALGILATATGDVAKSQQMATLAMDIAAARGVPVATAASALAKAYSGQTTSLSRLIPGLDQATLKSGNWAAISQELASVVGGSATAAANTQAGAAKRSAIAMQEAAESLGAAFLPIMGDVTNIIQTQVVPAIESVANWFKSLSPETQKAVVGFGLFAAATGPVLVGVGKVVSAMGTISTAIAKMLIKMGMHTAASTASATASGVDAAAKGTQAAATATQTAATSGATAAQWGLNAALLANPLTWIVVAVVALVAALVYLWNTNDGFREAVTKAWEAIKNAAVAVWDWLVAAFKKWGPAILTALLGPIAILVAFLAKNWDQIKATASTVWNAIVNFLKSAAQNLVNLFMNWTLPGLIIKHWDRIKEGASKLWNNVVNFFKTGAQRILDFFTSIVRRWLKVGTDIVTGIWNGIKSGWNMIINGLKDLAKDALDAVKSMLGISSPSKKFAEVGQEITNGMAKGVKDGKKIVIEQCENLASDASARSWIALGKAYMENKNGLKDVYDSITVTLAGAVTATGDAIDEATKKALEKGKKAVDKLTNDLKQRLANARKAFKDFSATIADGITEGFTFSNALQAAANAGEETGTSFLVALDSKAAEAIQFGTLIAKLVDAGLSEEGVAQIAAAGAEAGTRMANELLAGGADAIAKANALIEAVALMAKSVGDKAATEFYGQGVAAAKGMLDGFLNATAGGGKTYKEIMKIMDQLAKDASRTITLNVDVVYGGVLPDTGLPPVVTSSPVLGDGLVSSTRTAGTKTSTTSSMVTIAPGAVQVNVTGGDAAATEEAVNAAFEALVRELRAM